MPRELLHPKYWPLWGIIGVLRLLVLLPYSWQLKIGRALGMLIFWGVPSRRRISRINIKLCFPKKTDDEREQLVKDAFKGFGMGLMEALMAWFMSQRRFEKIPFHWVGKEHADAVLKQDKGLIGLGGHFSCLEIAGRCFSQHVPMKLVYKASRNPVFEYIVTKGRKRYTPGLIKHENMKEMVRALRNKETLWYAPDQDFGRARAVFSAWFGVPAATLVGVSVLARLGRANVIPVHFRRLKEGGYEGVTLPAFENYPSGDEQADTDRWQKLLEDFVRQHPEQYLWAHRRFKTRPEGEPPIY